jgi:hypothetical protein
MPGTKFSYQTQRNTPCQQNAQRWYMVQSINGLKNTKNSLLKRAYYYRIANYYLNGNAYVVL